MEASRSRSRTGGLPSKRRSGGGSGHGTAQSLNDDALRSIFSRLDDHFDLAHCSAVCKSWATLCRMKSGLILTGMGDKVLRLWSAESCEYMNEYNVPNPKMLVDFDFDENKIVGLTSSQLCIWRRSEPKSIFQSRGDSFNHGLCMSYAAPEVVIGCEDNRAFVYGMYSRSCSSIYRYIQFDMPQLMYTPALKITDAYLTHGIQASLFPSDMLDNNR